MRPMFRALSAVLALLAIALVSTLITMRLAVHGAEVRVPPLSGLTVTEAAALLHGSHLQTGIDGHFYSTTQPIGHVLTQSPAPGTLVRKSWRVRITVSLGPQKVAIPSLDGMDQSIAAITLRRSGLKVGDLVAIPWAYAPENTVIAQTPLPRATDVQNPKIGLLTAQLNPPPEQASLMPELTGETFPAAAATILHAGFKLAPLDSAATASALPAAQNSSASAPAAPPSGTVLDQSPAPGSRVLAGATIRLTVQP